MGSLILGIVILMAVPMYAEGQHRHRSERPTPGRTAIPREEAVQAVPASRTDRRAEARRETRTPSPREETADVASPSRAGGDRRNEPSTANSARERFRGRPAQVIPAPSRWTNRPATPLPSSIPVPNVGPRPFPNLHYPGLVQKGGNYRSRYRRPHSGPNVVFVPYASPVIVEREVVVERKVVDESAVAPAIVEQPSLARLILDIHPPTAQVFADGYYIGIPEDFRFEDGGAMLEPGPHRIDILARDYEPVSFDVNLARGQSATFRHILTPMMRAPQPAPDAAVETPPAAKPPMTFYLIPGCYMGNVPPKEANLPATCDLARAVSYRY